MDSSRSTHSKAKGSPGLTGLLENLSAKSKLDEFRRFFDLKTAAWREFRDKLHTIVVETSSWTRNQDLTERQFCAEAFLMKFGNHYWGSPGNREKHLIEEHLDSGECCLYPDHEELILEALVMLLEKDSKSRREPAANDVDFPTFPNLTGFGTTAPQPRSPELGSAPIPPASNTALAPTQGSRPAAPGLYPEHMGLYRNMLATYFLIQDEDDPNQAGPVCLSFQNYDNATSFIEGMERACSIDASSAQIMNEMPELDTPIFRHQTALVQLKWSGTTFVIRRGTNDLKALTDRVGCAWKAKERGELDMLEFVIEVKLKY